MMPRNLKQELLFGAMMVTCMVYGMVVYNIALATGSLTNHAFVAAFGELPLMGAIAYVIENLLVGKIAKKRAFHLVKPDPEQPIFLTLMISSLTVMMMCPIMSFFATLFFNGGFSLGGQFFVTWVTTVIRNFPMAFCWQIFAAGPFVRFAFGKIMAAKTARENAREAADSTSAEAA